MKVLPAFVSAITADGLAVLMNQPPTATISNLLGTAYESWLGNKAKVSHDILISEISKAKRLSNDVQPNTFFGLLHRYLNATKQGAARRNLHLMAQVLAGSLEQDCPFQADKLASHAELVANLTRDEIKFLAVFWSSHIQASTSPAVAIDPDVSDGQKIQIATHNLALERLVPTVLPSSLEFFATGGALARTGLLVARTVWNGTRFDTTSRLGELVQLCNFETETTGE